MMTLPFGLFICVEIDLARSSGGMVMNLILRPGHGILEFWAFEFPTPTNTIVGGLCEANKVIHATRFTAGLSSVYTIPNSGNSNSQDICNELFVPIVQLKNSSIIVTVSPCRPLRAHMPPARLERSHTDLLSSCLANRPENARSQLSTKSAMENRLRHA